MQNRPKALIAIPAVVLAVLAGFLPAQPARAASSRAAAAPAAAARPRQVITVTAASYSTTFATLRAYRVSGGRRVLVFGPWRARVGYNGVARPGRKREGDGRTPSGSYGFSFFFGVLPGAGFAFPFRHAYSYDVWDDESYSPNRYTTNQRNIWQ